MSEYSENPVVVTGLGCVAPVGNNVEAAMDNIFAGKDGIELLPEGFYDGYEPLDVHVAAQVKGLKELSDPLLKPPFLRRAHRSAQFALFASAEALRQAGLVDGVPPKGMSPLEFHGAVDPDRVAVSMGTGIGGGDLISEISDKMRRGQGIGAKVLQVLPDRIASMPSMAFGARGPVGGVTAACATGNKNIVEAARMLQLGEADVVLAGGAEAQVNPVCFDQFASIGALDKSTDPRLASRPFHTAPAGFVMGEGAGVLVLERLDHARKRGATVLGTLAGYGETADAYHDTSPSGEGAARALRLALRGLDIGTAEAYVNAHGTGTGGDAIELAAIIEVLGLDKLAAVSSTKGATGHLLGGAGALESIISIEALRRGEAPPTLKLDDPIEIAQQIQTAPLHAVALRGIKVAINNSFGFGGLNSVTAWTR